MSGTTRLLLILAIVVGASGLILSRRKTVAPAAADLATFTDLDFGSF